MDWIYMHYINICLSFTH